MSTKKVLFINLNGTSLNCFGIPELAQFSLDCTGAIELFKSLGYECNFHNPYKAKKQAELVKEIHGVANVLDTNEVLANINNYDCFVTRFGQLALGCLTGSTNFGRYADMLPLLLAVKNTNKTIYNISADYRTSVFPPHTKDSTIVNGPGKPQRACMESFNVLTDMINSGQYKILLAGEAKPECISHIDNLVFSNLTRFSVLGVTEIKPFNGDNFEYDYVYAGTAKLEKARKQSLDTLTERLASKATVGKVKIKGWESLTNYKNVKDFQDYTAKARLNIVFSEPWHNFVTIRFWESLVSGSIIAAPNTNAPAVELFEEVGLTDRILYDSSSAVNLLSGDLEKLYNEQVRAFNYYRNNLPKPYLSEKELH